MNVSPSYAGSNGGMRAQSSMRTQGLNYSGRIINYQFSVDGYIKSLHGGVFASASNENFAYGTYINNAYNIGYAYHLNLLTNKLKIIPSLQASYLSQSVDFSSYQWGNYPANRAAKEAYDLSSGLLIQYRNLFSGGVSVFHINQPDINVNDPGQLARKIQVHGAYTFHFSEKRLLQVMALYSKQKYYQTTKLNATLVLNHFIGGLGVTANDAYSAQIGYRHDYFTTQLVYALSGSKLSGFYGNIWELHFSANIRDKAHRHVLTNIENW
jgi:type IX secretion system PorP/SprF family membrane protein